jgi:hypothetical protein
LQTDGVDDEERGEDGGDDDRRDDLNLNLRLEVVVVGDQLNDLTLTAAG